MKSPLKEVYELNHFLFSFTVLYVPVFLKKFQVYYLLLCMNYFVGSIIIKVKSSRQLWEFFVLAMV